MGGGVEDPEQAPLPQAARLFHLAREEPPEDSLDPGRAPALRPGERFGEFELLDLLGRGGMGSVFRARDPAGREVALKLTHSPAAQRARFANEGEITAGLNHPGIVGIHAAGEVDGVPYLAYELVEGCRGLDEVLASVERRRALELMRDAARAVGYAHRQGVVHRDLKPENILVDASGRVRVADFGLARARDSASLTQTGALLGTPLFMAPEQARSELSDVGPASDVWALGMILYSYLAGGHPFQAPSLPVLLLQIGRAEVPPLPRGVSAALEAVCLKALSRPIEDRYADGEALAADLDRVLAGARPVAAGRPSYGWAVGGAALVLLSGLAAASLRGGAGVEPAAASDPREVAAAPGAVSRRKGASPGAFPKTPAEPPLPARFPGETPGFRFVLEQARRPGAEPKMMWRLGRLLEEGSAVDRDAAMALRCYRRAAARSPRYMASLAEKLAQGEGPPFDDLEEARAWALRGAQEGQVAAIVTYGRLTPTRDGARWLRRAADAGHEGGMLWLGLAYRHGRGVAKDPAQAFRWLERAAAAGNRQGQAALGECYLRGEGVEADPAKGLALLERAGAAGWAAAYVALGKAYRDGAGVPRDDSKAMASFSRAVRGGARKAAGLLEQMCDAARGTPEERARARSLLSARGRATR